jgi:hypothetical protein
VTAQRIIELSHQSCASVGRSHLELNYTHLYAQFSVPQRGAAASRAELANVAFPSHHVNCASGASCNGHIDETQDPVTSNESMREGETMLITIRSRHKTDEANAQAGLGRTV